MFCEHCHKNEATVHVSQTINGQSQEQHFCGDCARELGLNQPFKSYLDEWMKPGLTGQSIFDTAGGIPAFGSPATRSMVCPSCGQRYDDFRRSGLLGCSNCYVAFGDRLDAIFRRVQGGTRHIGRKACETADLQELQFYRHQLIELRQQLQQAVAEEAYETAAGLRDRVHALQKTIETMELAHTISDCRTKSSTHINTAESEAAQSAHEPDNAQRDGSNGSDPPETEKLVNNEDPNKENPNKEKPNTTSENKEEGGTPDDMVY